MSFTRTALYPCNPVTTRGVSSKLSSHQDKIIYANGRTIVIHDLKDLASSKTFSGHSQNTTVARFSPSGYYCASADATGLVKIWDTIGEDQSVKWQYKIISGRVNDLAWDGESKRMIVVGDGKDKFGRPIIIDTGASCGEIIGHSKVVNAVSIRHQRPYRAATGGDDGLIIFSQGVPYKHEKTIRTHTRFVQDIKYAPSGDLFASVGSDYKVFLYDGKTGDTLAEFTENAHNGSVMACSWSGDSKSLLTSSLDCTVRLWDVESRKVAKTWNVGKGISNQQVGCVWTSSDDLVSLSLSGVLNIFDKRENKDRPSRVLQAPQKAITSAVRGPSSTFMAGSADGRVFYYDTSLHSIHAVEGEGHTNLVSGLAAGPKEQLYSSGCDDRVRELEPSGGTFSFTQTLFSTSSQPKALTVTMDGTLFVVGVDRVEAVRSNQRVFELKPTYIPSAIGAAGNTVAIGAEDTKVYVYTWDGRTLSESYVLGGNKGPITAITVSANGEHIAAGDSAGKIVLFGTAGKEKITDRWAHHTARIASLAFLCPSATESATHVASISLDTNVYIYSVTNISKYVAIRGAAPGGGSAVLWLESQEKGRGKLVGAGADGCARIWEVTLP
ncbi:WD40-repeat-containing domain protein [Pisolithus orientalis]|uniref:WD40-repeat-containing domain protein n=1 Tax=Pisolithus orientalis TaxID=936130 RepID=UPI0022259FC6|nr:WD40-repeat-containing domain protein [Pisolithus orientalis]KAI6019903.1 WD40-repeat-containing domain protein [Pisolithus orientalis]